MPNQSERPRSGVRGPRRRSGRAIFVRAGNGQGAPRRLAFPAFVVTRIIQRSDRPGQSSGDPPPVIGESMTNGPEPCGPGGDPPRWGQASRSEEPPGRAPTPRLPARTRRDDPAPRPGGDLLLLMMAPQAEANDGPSLFRDRVRAILIDSCMACHDGTAKKGGAGPLPTRRGAGRRRTRGRRSSRATRRRARSSTAWSRARCRRRAGSSRPSRSAFLKAWIAAGAPHDGGPLAPRRAGLDWWALRPIVRPEPPEVAVSSRARNPIDAFVLDRLEREGFDPRARGRPEDTHPPPNVRPGRPAAHARGGRLVPGRRRHRRLRAARRSLARVPPLRRAVGAALVRRGPVRREPRLRDEHAPAQRLALPRLGHPHLQRGLAVRPVRRRAVRRGRAARRRLGSRGRRPASSSEASTTWCGERRTRGGEAAARGRPRRHDRGHGLGVPGPNGALRAMPRPQVRPHRADRLLRAPIGVRRRPSTPSDPSSRPTRRTAAAAAPRSRRSWRGSKRRATNPNR